MALVRKGSLAAALGLLIAAGAGVLYWSAQERPALRGAPVSVCFSWTIGVLPGVARAEGYFADEGLTVTLKPYPSGRDALNGMLSGDCDLATVAETPIMFKAFERQDFRILASTRVTTIHNKLVARTDRGVAEPLDLTGRRIGALRATSAHFFLYRFLLEHGMTTRDVEVVFPGTLTALEAALLAGDIDALALWSPHIERIRQELGENALVFESPGLVMNTANLVARRDFVDGQAGLVPPLLRAMLQAQQLVADSPQRAMAALVRQTGRTPDEVAANWTGELTLSLSQGFLLALEDEARWARSSGLVADGELPNFFDLMYLEGLMQVAPRAVTVLH